MKSKILTSKAKEVIEASWSGQRFDHLALSYFNLKNGDAEFTYYLKGMEFDLKDSFFDLASLTKPMTLGVLALMRPELFEGEKRALLEHRSGLPAWACLGRNSWQRTLTNFSVKENQSTCYSDLGFLKLMLLLEEETGTSLNELLGTTLEGLIFWKDLPSNIDCPVTGKRKGKDICGVVHDDNCFKINRFCSHAGLFSTMEGFVNHLFALEKNQKLLEIVSKYAWGKRERFLMGWDTVTNSADTLAGYGAPEKTFGHLGFTGTSFWIDADSGIGWALFTNVTKDYWFERHELNQLRKDLGALLWSGKK